MTVRDLLDTSELEFTYIDIMFANQPNVYYRHRNKDEVITEILNRTVIGWYTVAYTNQMTGENEIILIIKIVD